MASLNETISEIKETFADIRAAIIEKGVDVGECESPTVYDDKIRDIQSGSDGIALTSVTAEAYSAYGNPTANVTYNEGAKSMHFKFGLIKGEKGDKGDKGDTGEVGSAGVPPESIYTRRPDINNEDIEAPISVNEDGDVPEGWTPNPQGVTHDLQVEYVSTRRKIGNNWSDWSTPAVWSLWGEMGRDGNGLEYIYCLTKDSINVPQVPYSDPDKSESDLIDQFPLKAGVYEWTDDPQSVTAELNTCWVSVRKQSYDVENNQKWGPYSIPAVWAKYGKDGKEGGGRTIFVYTVSDTNVTSVPTPTGGEWDPETNGVTVPIDEEGVYTWYTNPPENSDGKKLWLSTATFNSSGTKLQDWCTPYCLTGEDGINGTDGQSIQFIYRLIPNKDNFDILRKYHETSGKKLTSDPTGNDSAPEKIDKLPIDDNTEDKEGWEVVDNYYTITDTEWTDEPRGIGEVDGKLYSIECVCIRTKTDEGWSEWSMPLLWSVWGEDGIDGAGVEYIYKITPEYDESGDKIDLVIPPVEWWENPDDSYPDWYNSEITQEEYWKIYNTLEFVPSGEWLSKHGYTDEKYKVLDEDWSDEPRDVSPEEPLEWVSIRRQHLNEDTGKLEWGSFSKPKIWNRFVHDGTAFKTQYVFIRNNGTPPTIPEGAGTFDMFDNKESFNVEYTDDDGNKTTYTWYDGIPSENPELHLWMSKRTFRASDVQEFDYDSSLETSEEEQRQEWLNSLFDKDWDAPILMTDTSKMQIEYYHPNKVMANLSFANDDEKNEYLSNSPDDNNHEPTSLNDYYSKYLSRESDEQYRNSYEIDWSSFDSAKDTLWEYAWRSSNITWSDEAGIDVYYMAISILKTDSNGKQTWSAWDIVRIKGERGDAGRDGTSVKILGSAAIVDVVPESQYSSEEGKLYKYILVNEDSTYKSYMWNDSGYESYTPITGDGFLIKHATENYTELWSYDGDSWENCGKFSGKDGDTAKIYIRFSDSSDGNPMLGVENGVPIAGKYIGIYATKYTVDDNSYNDYSKYSWSKWGGDDGWGYEQIFLLTTNKYNDTTPLPIPSAVEGDHVPDYCPIHELGSDASGGGESGEKWSDRPLTPTPDYPICWTVTRKASGNTFGPWKGVNEHGYGEGNYASIYQKYYYPNVEMSLSNDQAVVPLDIDGNIDSGFTSYLTTTIQLYSGNESVIATENFPVTISVEGLTLNSDVTIGGKTHLNEQWEFTEGSGWVLSFPASAINMGADRVSITAEYGYQSIKKEFKILKTDAAWEIFPDQSVLFRDPNTGYFTQEKLTGNIKKWVDNKWMNIDEGQFTWSYTSGGITFDGSLDTSENGEFEIDLSKLSNVESIRITVNDEIFEDIPVYANGKDGEAGITYSIDINPSQIKIDKDGNVSDHQIIATAYIFVGSNPPEEYINGKIKYSIDGGSEIEYSKPITTDSLVKNDSVEFKLYDSEDNYLGISQTVSIMRDSKPTFSVNASTPTIWVDSEEETPISDTCNINVSAYFENDLKYISNASAKRSVNGGAFEYCTCTNNKTYLTLSVPDEKVTECKYELNITFEDGNTWNGEVNCDILKRAPKGNDAVSPIAVHLSNPSMELSWFANGDVSLNSAECTIIAVKENNPVEITVGNNIESSPFEVTVEGNNTKKVVIRVSSADKIADGLYHVDIPITIESEDITRVIYVTVKEIPNVDTDIIMDQSINVVYAKETTDDKWVWDWGSLMSDGGAVIEKIEGKTYYYEKFAGIKNIYAKQNGVLVDKEDLKVLSIKIGDDVLSESTGEGTKGHYVFNGEDLIFSVINLMKILKEQTITEGTISFDVNGVSVDKKVLFNTNRTAYKRDVQLFPKEVNYGEEVTVSLNVRQWNTDGSWKEEPWDTYTYFNIYKGNEKLTPINGKLTFQNVTEDIELSFKWEYDDGYEELSDIQTISCVKQPVLDNWSIKANTPFVKVTHNAITGSGELVGNPISLIIQHQVGDSVTSYDHVPDGYKITYSCLIDNNNTYSESILSGKKLSIDDEELFTTINPVTIELKKGEDVIDSVTVEKTIVYPEPIIYPAGEYVANKSYNISYSQVPYIFVKTSFGEIKYYVGNRDILTETVDYDLKNTIIIDGEGNVTIIPIKDFPSWNQMESFEAIYADIGVFKQALVGPMVFYKDYVFSQAGINTTNAWGDPPGEECLYDVAISELEAIGFSSDDLFDHWKPNYLLNCKTGQIYLKSSGDNKSEISIGNSITIGGDDSAIIVKDLVSTESGKIHKGTLSIGKDDEQIINYVNAETSLIPSYFGVGVGNQPVCTDHIESGFVTIYNSTGSPWNSSTQCYGFRDVSGEVALSVSGDKEGPAVLIPTGFTSGMRPYIGNKDSIEKLGTIPLCYSPSLYIIDEDVTITLPVYKLGGVNFVQNGDMFEVWKEDSSSTITISCDTNFKITTSSGTSDKTSHAWKDSGRYKFVYYNGWHIMWAN